MIIILTGCSFHNVEVKHFSLLKKRLLIISAACQQVRYDLIVSPIILRAWLRGENINIFLKIRHIYRRADYC